MPPVRPNVVLIVADDMGYGDLGCFSDGTVRTPHLDRLVEEGTCFRQHYSASPICSPARAALLTGRYPHRTGAITQHEVHGLDRIALREVTIADAFRAAGYRTSLVGKWHNGTLDARFEPNARGFDEFTGFCGGWTDYFRYHLRRNQSTFGSQGTYLTDLLTQEAVDFIRRQASSPFFLYVPYNAPHSPFQAPAGMVARYRDKGLSRIVATTYAMIEGMDQGIGRVLGELDRLGLANNTIVAFTSDNGPAFFNPPYMLEEGEPTFNERYNAGLRGSKGWIYDGGIRVPMVLRHPGFVPAGMFEDSLAHFTDWMPTLLSMVGIPRPGGEALDGHDLSPLFDGRGLAHEPRQFWQWNFYWPDIGTNAAMRDGRWKLVRPMIRGTRFFRDELCVSDEDRARTAAFVEADIKHKEDPQSIQELIPVPRLRPQRPEEPQLFDLAADPGESTDLAPDHPSRVRRMLARLEGWFEDVEADRATIRWS
ncbi:MAG: sulfatase-like hydrolase/transferase [Bryobacterales bacterium]|nr:sulfatase-like hydrolase/transferase [Bryobacterales bacterium]